MSTTERALREALEKFLRDNDPEGFGCACEPGHLCGPCQWSKRTEPLRKALANPPSAERQAVPETAAPLVRFGRTGPQEKFLFVPMADGYWTPWHIAQKALDRATARAAVASLPPAPESRLGNFVRSSDDERGKVYERVIPAAIEAQAIASRSLGDRRPEPTAKAPAPERTAGSGFGSGGGPGSPLISMFNKGSGGGPQGPQNRWIDVTEGLPKDYEKVDVWVRPGVARETMGRGFPAFDVWCEKGKWIAAEEKELDTGYVTYWNWQPGMVIEPTAKVIEAMCNDDPDLSVGEATEILRRGTEP